MDIYPDALYCSYLSPPHIPETVFIELIKFDTMSVEFSLDNVICKQIGGISTT